MRPDKKDSKSHTERHQRKGHGHRDALVPLALVCLVISILLPALSRARVLSKRTAVFNDDPKVMSSLTSDNAPLIFNETVKIFKKRVNDLIDEGVVFPNSDKDGEKFYAALDRFEQAILKTDFAGALKAIQEARQYAPTKTVPFPKKKEDDLKARIEKEVTTPLEGLDHAVSALIAVQNQKGAER